MELGIPPLKHTNSSTCGFSLRELLLSCEPGSVLVNCMPKFARKDSEPKGGLQENRAITHIRDSSTRGIALSSWSPFLGLESLLVRISLSLSLYIYIIISYDLYYVYIYIYIHTYICIYIYIYIYTHIHTYTRTLDCAFSAWRSCAQSCLRTPSISLYTISYHIVSYHSIVWSIEHLVSRIWYITEYIVYRM